MLADFAEAIESACHRNRPMNNSSVNTLKPVINNPYKRYKPSPAASVTATVHNVSHHNMGTSTQEQAVIKEMEKVPSLSEKNVRCARTVQCTIQDTIKAAPAWPACNELLPLSKQFTINNPYARTYASSEADPSKSSFFSFQQPRKLLGSSSFQHTNEAINVEHQQENNLNLINNQDVYKSYDDVYDDGGIDWNSIPLEGYNLPPTTELHAPTYNTKNMCATSKQSNTFISSNNNTSCFSASTKECFGDGRIDWNSTLEDYNLPPKTELHATTNNTKNMCATSKQSHTFNSSNSNTSCFSGSTRGCSNDGGIDWNSIRLGDYNQPSTTMLDATANATQKYLKEFLKPAPTINTSWTVPSSPSMLKISSDAPKLSRNAVEHSNASTHSHPSTLLLSRPPEWSSNMKVISPSKLSSSLPSDPIRIYNQEGKLLPSLPSELSYNQSRILPVAVDEEHRCLVKHANVSAPLKNGWKLMPHQKLAILKGLQMRRLVVAYDMGLGKTALACVWANAFKKTFSDLKVIIIAPVSLQKEWKNTATRLTDLVLMEEDKPFGLEVASWGRIPQPPPHQFVVIADEAHSMQSISSQRTKDTLVLLKDKNCIGCMLLTGTPMKNGKPANLFPLLKGVKHPLGDNQRVYETYFCNGQNKNFGNKGKVWDASGSSNLEQLHAHIASHVIHMTKEDCLEDLPGKTREYRQIQVSSKFEYRYQTQLRVLAAVLQLSKSDNNDDSNALLGAFARVRQISSFSKIDATVALARSILEKEPSIVIFTCFVDVAKSVHQKLEASGWSGELLTGQTPATKRQDMVDNFQAGLSSAFVCTFGAGGVGLTLTAACTIVLLDRPWTPGDAFQAEDRVRRIGQTKEVKSIWMRAFDIDKQIDDMIEQKKQNSHAVVGGKSSSNNGNNAAKISIFQLVASIVPTPSSSNDQQLGTNSSNPTTNA